LPIRQRERHSPILFPRASQRSYRHWGEFDGCDEVTSGSWTINTQPKFGTVSFGTVNGTFCSDPATFGAIYYTLTSDTATSDTFSATWNGDGRSSPEAETFTLQVFDVSKNDGDCGCGGKGAASPPTGEGDPIDAATGNTFETETDFVGAANTGLELRRYYNSFGTVAATTFGVDWTGTFARSISVANGGATVQTIQAEGRTDTFTLSSGAYVADPDVMDRLSRVPPTGTQTGWQLIKADDSIEAYTLAGLLRVCPETSGRIAEFPEHEAD
jgi:hypothetical protein